MEQKSIDQLTNEEILHQQLQLLAEKSKDALVEELPELTHAMVEIVKNLPSEKQLKFGKTSF